MLHEPDIDRAALIRALERAYAIRIQDLQFMPTGWLAACYVVTCGDGRRYFLKLHSEDRPAAFAVSSRAFYLPLVYQLHHKGILPTVPAPIPNRDGALETGWTVYAIELLQFVAGIRVGHDGMDADILARLADMVGILHQSRSRVSLDNPLIDDFEIRFEPALIRAVDEALQFAEHPRAGMRALSGFLQDERGRILEYLDRLRDFQAVGRQLASDKVICHTDLHGENLMLNTEGRLVLVDWEGAVIAPPEHDLMFFAGEADFWTVFFPHYRAAYRRAALGAGSDVPDLHPKVFAFYYLRRGLEDLTDWIVRIREGQGSTEQDREDLDEMRGCLAGMTQIPATVRTLAKRLDEAVGDGKPSIEASLSAGCQL